MNINKKNIQNQKAKMIVILPSAMSVYFSFGIYHIGKLTTVDEVHWLYDRIPRYWKGILEQKWKLTYVHEKPGITLTIISGAGLLKYNDPENYQDENHPAITKETKSMEVFYRTFRLPILIFNGLFSLFFLWVIWKITKNHWISLWSWMLILLSPILIGMTQNVNSDSLLWTFTTAAILSFIALFKTEEKKFVWMSALFLGLSVLTKFTSVILMPFLFVVIIIYYLEKNKKWKEEGINVAKKIWFFSVAYFLVILGSILLFAVLMPASIVNPKRLFWGTIGYPGMEFILWPIFGLQILIMADSFFGKSKIILAVLNFFQSLRDRYSKIIYIFLSLSFIFLLINYIFGSDFMHLEKVPFDAYQEPIFYEKNWIHKMILEFRPIVFSVTPLVLISVLYLWIKAIFKPIKERFIVFILSIFFLIFCAAVIQEKLLNIIRYSIVIYPLLSILAAIGIEEFLSNKKNEKISRFLISLIILILSFVSLWLIKPFYFNYTSNLLPKKYIVTDTWGLGGYEAAQYLNALPDAQNLAVWSDSTGVCEFFVGECVKGKCVLPENKSDFDYYVLNRRGEILFSEKSNDKYCKKNPEFFQATLKKYKSSDAVFDLAVDNRPGNFVKIIKNEK